MRKLLFALVALLAVNLVSAQNYEKSYIGYKQKAVEGKWGKKEVSDAYFKFSVETSTMHIHDNKGLHLNVHEKLTATEVETTTSGDWVRNETTLIVDKDYNGTIPVGTEIRWIVWTNSVSNNAAYALTTTQGEFLYSVYKHESSVDGATSTVTFKPF